MRSLLEVEAAVPNGRETAPFLDRIRAEARPDAPMEAPPRNSYDEVPYRSYPYPQTRPERLATVATLFGMKPQAVNRCRVLELGCCSGGNLIPMAEQLPDSEFVGIDGSAHQAAEGQAIVEKLGLTNVRLQHRNILDVGPELGRFDYIITHGVYSWVPDPVQEKILAICKNNLTPQGVAYVSYNTYPGWHMRGMIRDMMCFRARSFRKPADRIRHARGLLDFLTQAVPAEDNPYGILLKKELNGLRGKEDYYLYHEHLEECNAPVYFFQFMERAGARGLQYLGEADFSVMSVQNFPEQVGAVLQSVATDVIETEQYMDFVRNRMFRQTLLCHQDVTLDRTLPAQRMAGLHVASSAKPETPVADVRSTAPVVFRGPNSVTTTTEPLMKAAMLYLGEVWPRSVPFAELLAVARSRLNPEPVVVDAAHVTADAHKLAEPLIRCYATTQVELSVLPSAFTLQVSERPTASRLARLQAEIANTVTNLRHESVSLNDLERNVIRHLDGNHDRGSLVEALAALCDQRVLVVHVEGQPVRERERAKQILGQALEPVLAQLARHGLLIG